MFFKFQQTLQFINCVQNAYIAKLISKTSLLPPLVLLFIHLLGLAGVLHTCHGHRVLVVLVPRSSISRFQVLFGPAHSLGYVLYKFQNVNFFNNSKNSFFSLGSGASLHLYYVWQVFLRTCHSFPGFWWSCLFGVFSFDNFQVCSLFGCDYFCHFFID